MIEISGAELIKKRENDYERADRAATMINLEEQKREGKNKLAQFGVCWNCLFMHYTLTKYGKEEALCERYDRKTRLSASDPVVDCSDHADKHAMSLSMMWGIAKLIDTDKPKQAGFVIAEEKK